ncbi:MAG: DUF748 domain-containing protein [Proteobacteria bacterium]|nr:DUF748 domain-containing protein [Pseudomonadota bacterium]MBU4295264.1 DUF748 domain-containing protein [Pseudomonadota bacterium]MCG2750200.1 DUF748 domain-containing protein [Desulfobulbaceae bacterium]
MAELKLRQRWKSLSRLQRWSIIVTCSLFFYTVFGFWILPAIIRSQLEKKLSLTLHRQTTVQEVKINPYTLQAAVNGFNIQDPGGKESFVSFDSLQVNLQWVSLFKRAIIVKSFALSNPYSKIVFNKDKSFNFSDLAAGDGSAKKAEKKEEEKTAPLQFSINNIDLSGGKIDFEDKVKDVKHQITDLHIALPFLSDLPYELEIFTKPAFAAVINGTPISMIGESKPFYRTRQSEINVNSHDINLTDYLAYLPEYLNFIIKNGRLDLDLTLSFLKHEDGNPALNIQGKASLREIKVVDRQQQPLLAFPELTVDIDRAYILRKEFHLAKIIWRQPELFLQRGQDGQFNLAGLVSPASPSGAESKAAPPAAAPRPLLLEVADAELAGATIHFTDRTVSGPLQTTLQPVNLQVKDFSTAPDKSAGYQLALTSESGEQVSVGGSFSLDPLKVAADVGLENVQLGKYRPYYENALRAELAADKVKAAAHIDYAAAGGTLLISGLGLELGGFSMTGPDGAGKVVVPDFSISEAEVNIKDKTVLVGKCLSKGAVIPLTRRKDGTINLQDFLASALPAEKTAAEVGEKDDAAAPQPAWQVAVKSVDFTEYEVAFIDQVPEEPVVLTMNQLHLAIENVTTRPGEECAVDLDLLLNKTGKVKVQGKAGLSPLALRFDLDLADLPLKSVQPYVEPKLNIIMVDGRGAVKGKMTLDKREGGEVAVTFQGEAGSRGFACLDAKQAEKLLSWQAVEVKKVDVQTSPMRIKAGEIVFTGLSAFVLRNREGVLNLSTIVRQEAGQTEPHEAPAAEGKPAEVEIKLVRLANCRIDFADRSVAPQFNTTLQQIDGGIKGLATGKDVSAEVNITAKLDQHSPVKVTGTIRPWQDFYTDVTAEFTDIELSPVSPYSIKFIGYPLTKGKLNLNLHYLIEDGKLISDNKAFIDQITLGDYVKNETAANLPVQLAISLLKNRKGEIDLNIPVSGRLDDPEFSVAGVVFKILYNLIVKAATSPFSLLGAIFEGGGEEQYVQFSAGQARISPEAMEVLAKFAKALYDRPAIKVDLTGRADATEDGKALTQIRFDRLLKVQKMKDLARKEAAVSEVDAIEITADEYDRYLKKAYKAAEFERPTNFLGMLKDIPPGEMEKLLYDHIVISDNDLRNLAMERAGVVRDVLIEKGPVEPERIFLIEPKPGAGGQLGLWVEIAVK